MAEFRKWIIPHGPPIRYYFIGTPAELIAESQAKGKSRAKTAAQIISMAICNLILMHR